MNDMAGVLEQELAKDFPEVSRHKFAAPSDSPPSNLEQITRLLVHSQVRAKQAQKLAAQLQQDAAETLRLIDKLRAAL